MKKIFEKYETVISISLIIIYVVLNSFCIQKFGITDYRCLILNLTLTLAIIIFIAIAKLGKYYGLTNCPKLKKFLYFIPLILIMSSNLWSGIHINYSVNTIIIYILSMICIGFLEEIIFRGFLFKMMEKDNIKTAILVSSLTFGLGHIVNLLNGAELIATLIQICYAIPIGYLFVIIFQKGKSLYPCIIAHVVINALSIFNVENVTSKYITPVIMIIVCISYALYLKKALPDLQEK